MTRRIQRLCLWWAGLTALFAAATNAAVLLTRTEVADNLPPRAVALVFAAGMKTDDGMSDLQAERVKRAVELYREGKAQILVMTGDDGRFRVDEVSSMRQYALSNGVPTSSVFVDPHGYRTYESCRRAREVYGFREALAVSQAFHLPRIAYLCRHFGVDIVGVPAPLRVSFPMRMKTYLREIGARAKAWVDINFWHPRPPVE